MKKVGILGGGQLGRMLLQAAANYPVETYVLENDSECPAAHLCHHFTKGDIRNFDDVYNFGKSLDAITIEIENVNVDALEKLEQEGVLVVPNAKTLKSIKNKISQKEFFKSNEIPTSDFVVTNSKSEVQKFADYLPAVHKSASGGYDGKGVQIINDISEIDVAFDEPSVLEKKVAIKKEIAMIVAVSQQKEIVLYDAVDMVFDPRLNLLLYQISPAELSEKLIWQIEAIVFKLVKAYNSAGLFAVELFIDENNIVLVNEVAPRVHNSGHHTIEACYSSQFDMMWRILLNYPLGNTELIKPAAIVNLIGEKDFSGKPKYQGLESVLSIDNAFVHIYGKKETKPGRKMGHVTVLSNDIQDLKYKVKLISNELKVIA